MPFLINVNPCILLSAAKKLDIDWEHTFFSQAYLNSGAIIQEDISDASVIFGVKQVPIDALIPGKTYCFFSHTIKAQEANMPLLDAILEKVCRSYDFEWLYL